MKKLFFNVMLVMLLAMLAPEIPARQMIILSYHPLQVKTANDLFHTMTVSWGIPENLVERMASGQKPMARNEHGVENLLQVYLNEAGDELQVIYQNKKRLKELFQHWPFENKKSASSKDLQ